jgi:hypothetical protein
MLKNNTGSALKACMLEVSDGSLYKLLEFLALTGFEAGCKLFSQIRKVPSQISKFPFKYCAGVA